MIYFLTFFIIIVLFKIEPNVMIDDKHYQLKIGKNRVVDISIGNVELIFLISLLMLFIIGAIRSDVGTDYAIYSDYHIPKVLSGDYFHIEPFSTLLFLLGGLSGSYQVIFALIHFLILVFTIKAIYDQSVNYSFSFYLFFTLGFFNMSMNLMRQSIAIAIFLYALKYINQKNLGKYFLWIAIATMFHKTAFIYFPLYFLNYISFSFKKLFGFILVLIPLSLFFDDILDFITKNLGIYRNYWGKTEMSTRIDHNFSLTYWSVNLMTFLLMLFLYRINSDNNEKLNQTLSNYIYIQFGCLVVMYVALVTYLPNFDRILTMFSYVQIISLPYFFSVKINSKIHKYLVYFTLIILMIGFYMLYISKNIGETFPYQTIFN